MAAKCRVPISDPSIKDASLSELEASLLFIRHEEESFFSRWDYMLGLVWTESDLQSLAKSAASAEENAEGNAPIRTPMGPNEKTRFPLSLLIRPELIEQLKDRVLPGGTKSKNNMPHVPDSAISLSSLSKEEFLKRMGASPAPAGFGDDDSGSVYDRSNAPATGFQEGPLRGFNSRRR